MQNVNVITSIPYYTASRGVASLRGNDDQAITPTLGFPPPELNGEGETGGGFMEGFIDLATGNFGAGIMGIFSNLFGGIFQQGWSISCLGNQAYNKSDFEREMNDAKAVVNSTTPSSVQSLTNMLNQMSWRTSLDEHIANNYRSSCSKNLRLKRGEYCRSIIEQTLPNVEFTSSPRQETSPNQYTWIVYDVTAVKTTPILPPAGGGSTGNGGGTTGNGSGTIGNGGITGGTGSGPIIPDWTNGFNPNDYYDASQGLLNAFKEMSLAEQSALQNFASSNGKSLEDILSGYFSGQIRIVNGKVVWAVNAGNAQNNPLLTYLMYGGIAFMAYKIVKK